MAGSTSFACSGRVGGYRARASGSRCGCVGAGRGAGAGRGGGRGIGGGSRLGRLGADIVVDELRGLAVTGLGGGGVKFTLRVDPTVAAHPGTFEIIQRIEDGELAVIGFATQVQAVCRA